MNSGLVDEFVCDHVKLAKNASNTDPVAIHHPDFARSHVATL